MSTMDVAIILGIDIFCSVFIVTVFIIILSIKILIIVFNTRKEYCIHFRNPKFINNNHTLTINNFIKNILSISRIIINNF